MFKKIRKEIRIIIAMLLCITLLPLSTYAKEKEYSTMNVPFSEYTLVSEETKEWEVPVSYDLVKSNVDIVFVLDQTGSMSTAIRKAASAISDFYQELYDNGASSIQASLIGFKDIDADSDYYQEVLSLGEYTAEEMTTALTSFATTVRGGGDSPEDDVYAYIRAVSETPWREDAQKIVVLLTDAETKTREDMEVNGYPVTYAGASQVQETYGVETVLMVYSYSSKLSDFANALGVSEYFSNSEETVYNNLKEAVIPNTSDLEDVTYECRISTIAYESDGEISTDVSTSVDSTTITLSPGESNAFHLSATAVSAIEVNRYGDATIITYEFYKDGELIEGQTQVVSYQVKETPVRPTIIASKTLDGRTLKDGEFNFELELVSGSEGNINGLTESKVTTTNDEEGNIIFDGIIFNQVGTYLFKLTEIAGNEEGMTYDEKVYYAQVVVISNDSETYEAEVNYYDSTSESEMIDIPTFNNTYESSVIEETPTTTTTTTTTSTSTTSTSTVKTGDTNSIIYIGIVIIISLALAFIVVYKKLRLKKQIKS